MINNVKSYLSIVNQRESDRWHAWSLYREKLTYEVVKVLSASKHRDLLIIGSGSLDDLDMNQIIPKSKIISFLDLDMDSTQNGLVRQKISSHDMIFIEQDITRFDDVEFFSQWHTFMLQNPTLEETFSFIEDQIKKVFAQHFQMNILKTYDVVVVLPIYTQLIYHEWVQLIEEHFPKSWSKEELEKMKSYILDLMVPLMNHVNEGIKACVKPSGQIIAFSDLLEWNIHDFHVFEKAHPSLSEHDFMAYYQSYLNQYGMGLGDFGLWSLKDQLHFEGSKLMLWPFSSERMMLVQMMILFKS